VSCDECHTSESAVRFDPIGLDCINCHNDDYLATNNPNHANAGYSMDCSECHNIFAFEWASTGISHDFFPLTDGHEIADCAKCHGNNDYANASPECISCHQSDFTSTTTPDHEAIGFSTDCASCHTTNPGWNPAEFTDHDSQFPIYSGEHNGEWDACIDCHIQPNDISLFSCIDCHEHNKQDMDEEHSGVNGYSYNSTSCLACHPTGSSDDEFNHNQTDFALTGVHQTTECIECHSTGFVGTSSNCFDCHQDDFNQSINPSHLTIDLSTDCASCHTTDPEWNPATFSVHNEYYALNGAHAAIANDCATCHDGDYNNTPNSCFGCHETEYNQTTDPEHTALQFSTDCVTCHTEVAWEPSTFDHDGQYFPIYSGEHNSEWDGCIDCHTNPSNYAEFTCITCHTNPETDDEHPGVSGYMYNSPACFACHPTGEGEGFDHNLTAFPLTGAHLSVDCLECHASGFEGTSPVCMDCHIIDFNQSSNPNHVSLSISTDCITCHTTEPEWNPATFAVHNEYYALNGAHAAIANDCASCHNGDYNNTPYSCFGCHETEYNQTTDPNHTVLQFSTDCATCHSENAWEPSTFDHDGQYFPIYSGEHNGEWDDCIDCHTNPSNYAEFTCVTCHSNPETDNEHTGVSGYMYNSSACFACHPTGEGEGFNHNLTSFPLTGAHLSVDCLECHASGFEGTSTLCMDCHTTDFNQSANPNHVSLGISTDCVTCHTTEPEWNPATFAVHNEYYALNGAHAAIANDCASCHSGNYNNTPNSCFGCHETEYNQTTDPNHTALQFSTDCAICHSENAWEPSTFDHDGQYFPIYSGEHNGEWDGCIDCHTNPSNYAEFTCVTCHSNPETDNEHSGVSGYMYNSTACFACHPTGEGEGFNHNQTSFPLTGAHQSVDCQDCHSSGYPGTSTICADCHMTAFNQSANPNHVSLGISTDCATCHTTEPEWNPATFAVHNEYYALNGAHAAIANDCASCHNGNYNNTPNSCFGCHETEYNQTTDPDHTALQFSTDCATCHTETAWEPSTFDHDGQYFPIYSGEHNGEWDNCIDCHTNPSNYAEFTCVTCHSNPETDNEHTGVSGYMYNSTACFACHPTGEGEGFNHNETAFPLTGAHLSVDCQDCHISGYSGTSTICADCHMTAFNQSTNPNHVNLGISTDCASCHTTEPEWNPATFAVHNEYYALNGAHAVIANDCATCHNGNYNNTPNSCFGCHETEYSQTIDPNHQTEQYPTDCTICHSESAWVPSNFDHNNSDFPLTGAHINVGCASCHASGYSGTPTDCFECHSVDYNQSTNPSHTNLVLSTDCASCHTTEPEWNPATFAVHNQYYALNGAHAAIANDCATCHNGNYNNTPNTCFACHETEYNQTTNPDHQIAQFPTDCASCHTENEWVPSTFDHDGMYFPIYSGRHEGEWNTCNECHTNAGNYTLFSCIDCHEHNNQSEVDDDHSEVSGYSYNSNACFSCHPTGED
jgi:hypothetical protein